jgi:hypothetical protein
MPEESTRTRVARAAAEAALVRVVHHYGETPEFVLLGGLVPELLCSQSSAVHAGTTDIDVQVDLEIVAGSTNARRLENALANAEFEVDPHRVWRWLWDDGGTRAVVKFELLSDLDDAPDGATLGFDGCESLGAINLRGTGFATRDWAPRELQAKVQGVLYAVQVRVAELSGFLLSKACAARERRAPKDWYDIAFVLLHNDLGGPIAAARRTGELFSGELGGPIRTALDDLLANFELPGAQGADAYASQMSSDHEDIDQATLRADAAIAVREFHAALFPAQP